MDRDSFVFYRSFYEAIKDVPKRHRTVIYESVFEYVFEQKEAQLDGIPSAIWKLIRPQIDSSAKRYENSKKGAEHGKKGAEYGKLGGRPKKEKTPLKGDTEVKNKNPLNVNVNENVNDNVNVNVNVNASEPDENTQHTECDSNTQTTKPTSVQIAVESVTEGYGLDGPSLKAFYDYNEERGWKMDWKVALKKWAEREKPPDRKPKPFVNKFQNFERNHDNDEMAKKIIQMQIGGNG